MAIVEAGRENAQVSVYGPCQLCGREKITSDRYPTRICRECAARAVDAEGRPMRAAMRPGMVFVAEVLEDGTWRPLEGDSAVMFVDGRRCVAREDYWGDVVVQIVSER